MIKLHKIEEECEKASSGIWSILFDGVPPEHAEKVAKKLLELIREDQ